MPVSAGAVLVKQPAKPAVTAATTESATLVKQTAHPVAATSAGTGVLARLQGKSFTPAAQTGDLSHGGMPVLDDFPLNGTLNNYWSQSVDDSTSGAALPTISGGSLGGGIAGSTSIVWSRERFAADQAVALTINTKPSVDSTNIHMGVRISGATAANSLNGYQGYLRHFTGSDTFEIGRRDLGVFTSLTGQLALTWAVGDVFELRAVGTTISLWQQVGGSGAWTQLASVTDSTYTSPGRISLGGVGTQWRVWVLRASSLPVVLLANRQAKAVAGSVHASSQGSNPARTFQAAVTLVPVLVKQLVRTMAVSNPPAAILTKNAAISKTAAAATTGTVTSSKTQAVKVLSAAASTTAAIVRAKLLTVTAGFNTFIPPGFVNVTPVASVARLIVQGKVVSGTVVAVGRKTFRLSFTKSAPVSTAASVAALKAQHLATLAASAQAAATTLTRKAVRNLLAVVVGQPKLVAARPYAVRTSVSTVAFISHTVTPGIATLTLVPAVPGSLSLATVNPGTLTLTPIV